jgi:hypothetical protein
MSDIRDMIDEAKRQALAMDNMPIEVPTPDGGVRSVSRKPKQYSEKSVEIDKSNVAVAPDKELAAALIKQLIEIRSEKRVLDDRDSAIKSVLQDVVGELEYLALEDDAEPVVSLKHESSVRLNSARVKEAFPVEENPDFYSAVTSRPLRLMG